MNDLKQWVLDASSRPEVRAAVRQIYAELQDRINQRRPICLISGLCCRFDEYGHRLYVTTAELATFVAELAQTKRPTHLPTRASCVFQDGKLCSVHTIRPMGCRLFFCDATATDWQREVYEHFHARLKELHRELSIPYAYVEWRSACQNLGFDHPGGGVANTKSF